MDKSLIALLGAAMAVSPGLAAADHRDGREYATVISATPIVRQVRIPQAHEECREEPVIERTVYRGHHDPGAVFIGGLIGGVIGHQFGKGRGKDAATVAGALIGASHAANHHGHHGARVVERTVYETTCRTVRASHYEERVEGYDVAYRYNGRIYHTRMPYDPGKRIRVRIDVTPVVRD